jgi:hypothetical protein
MNIQGAAMRSHLRTTTNPVEDLMHGTKDRHGRRRVGAFRRPRFRPGVELLDARALLSTVTVSGNVFVQQDVSGNYANPTLTADSGQFLAPVTNSTVTLDGGNSQPSTGGIFSFAVPADGKPHTIAITPPSGDVGFNNQSL